MWKSVQWRPVQLKTLLSMAIIASSPDASRKTVTQRSAHRSAGRVPGPSGILISSSATNPGTCSETTSVSSP